MLVVLSTTIEHENINSEIIFEYARAHYVKNAKKS